MNTIRTIRKIVVGQHTTDGAGVKLIREIGYHDAKEFDPFLMLDAFDSSNPADYVKGFPWHPHRGIETVTYLIDGEIEHGDSMGNHGSILAGDCQWMTAGSGIIHQEMPQPSGRMRGTQLWLNLPARSKMVPPKYRSIINAEIPLVEKDGTRVRILCGNLNGTRGAIVGDYVDALYLDVEMSNYTHWNIATEVDHTLFIYIVSGEAHFGSTDQKPVGEKNVVLFNNGNRFDVQTGSSGVRFFLMSGKPIHEPIAWGGPIVMNTREELDIAFRELDENTFIK